MRRADAAAFPALAPSVLSCAPRRVVGNPGKYARRSPISGKASSANHLYVHARMPKRGLGLLGEGVLSSRHRLQAWLAGTSATAFAIIGLLAAGLPAAASAGVTTPDACIPQHYGWTFEAANNWAAPNPGLRYSKGMDGCNSAWLVAGTTTEYYIYFTKNGVQYAADDFCFTGENPCQIWDPATNFIPFYYSSAGITTGSNLYF